MPEASTAQESYDHWAQPLSVDTSSSSSSSSSTTASSSTSHAPLVSPAASSVIHHNTDHSAMASPAPSPLAASKPIRKPISTRGSTALGAELRKTMTSTMAKGDLKQLVKLPPKADRDEWIALLTIHFLRTCESIYSSYRPLCDPTRNHQCATMSAGDTEYLWRDAVDYPRPSSVPAATYIGLALKEAQQTVDDPKIFPVDAADPFPPNFIAKVKEIFKRLFRLFAHLYYAHYKEIKALASSPEAGVSLGISSGAALKQGADRHLNSCFKHFILFAIEFQLIDSDTLSPLQSFINAINDAQSSSP